MNPHCGLDQDDLTGDAAWVDSTLPCGRLSDLSEESGVLLDVGHAHAILGLRRAGTRLLSHDVEGHWVLWDLLDRSIVARGRSTPGGPSDRPVEPKLAGNTLVSMAASLTLEVRSAVDGALLSTLPVANLTARTPFGVSVDGGYVWVAQTSGLHLFAVSGTALASVSGDYSTAKIFAGPSGVRIGGGPAGANLIESIPITVGGSSTSAPFQGSFHAWFLDGGRFLTTTSTTVRAYSSDTIALDAIAALPTVSSLTGQGDYFWTYDPHEYRLDLYAVSSPELPQSTFAFDYGEVPAPAGMTGIGVILNGPFGADAPSSVHEFQWIDLSGPTPESTTVELPSLRAPVFGSDDIGYIAIGGHYGEVFDLEHRDQSLSCGAVLSIAGAPNGTAAVATAAGGILLFHLAGDTREYRGNIAFRSGHVELSIDGSLLAASAPQTFDIYSNDRSLRVYTMATADELKLWPYTWDDRPPLFYDFSMSADGRWFSHLTGVPATSSMSYTQTVLDLDDNVVLTVSPHPEQPLRLSPDGSWAAAPTGSSGQPGTTTNLYENGTLVDAVAGYPMGWLDEDRVLITNNLVIAYDVRTRTGELTPLPQTSEAQVLSPSEVAVSNTVMSLPGGEILWQCPTLPQPGASSGDYMVLVVPNATERVLIDRY